MATRATPEQYFQIEIPLPNYRQAQYVAQAPAPQPIYIMQQAPDYTPLIIFGGIVVIGVLGVVALYAVFRGH